VSLIGYSGGGYSNSRLDSKVEIYDYDNNGKYFRGWGIVPCIGRLKHGAHHYNHNLGLFERENDIRICY